MRGVALILALLACCGAKAQQLPKDSIKTLSSFAVRIDVAAPLIETIGMGCTGYEGAARIGLWNKLFPTLEGGYGKCNYTDESTKIGSKVRGPYFRIGADYNFTKKNKHHSRFMFGVRYGFSTYKYDVDYPTPDYANPSIIVGTNMKDFSGSAHWLEVGINLETRLWKMVGIGWALRYKFRLSQNDDPIGAPWAVPGFGESGSSAIGGHFYVGVEF